jgi:tRNA A-37 threonylcarbamoyl transferase component Bud32
MLLSPVGVARKAKVGIRASKKMVQLLSELHRHDPPYCHGDPRIQNIITDGDSLRFIDFAFGFCLDRYPTERREDQFAKDMLILLKSIVHDGIEDSELSLSLLTNTKRTYRISSPSTTSSALIFNLGSNKGESLQKHGLERQKIKICQQLPILECAFQR